jgi:thioredoxin
MELLTIESFKKKIFDFDKSNDWNFKKERPVIINFYVDWCDNCKRLNPVLEELQLEYSNKVEIFKINVDMAQEIAAIFGIMNVPTLLFIPISGELQMTQGVAPKDVIDQVINNVLLDCRKSN